jgi:hypothetical protein
VGVQGRNQIIRRRESRVLYKSFNTLLVNPFTEHRFWVTESSYVRCENKYSWNTVFLEGLLNLYSNENVYIISLFFRAYLVRCGVSGPKSLQKIHRRDGIELTNTTGKYFFVHLSCQHWSGEWHRRHHNKILIQYSKYTRFQCFFGTSAFVFKCFYLRCSNVHEFYKHLHCTVLILLYPLFYCRKLHWQKHTLQTNFNLCIPKKT